MTLIHNESRNLNFLVCFSGMITSINCMLHQFWVSFLIHILPNIFHYSIELLCSSQTIFFSVFRKLYDIILPWLTSSLNASHGAHKTPNKGHTHGLAYFIRQPDIQLAQKFFQNCLIGVLLDYRSFSTHRMQMFVREH